MASNDGSLDPFYAKVVDVAGFKVASSSAVRDAAVLEAAYTLARMTRNRPDLVATLVAEGVHMAVIGEDEVLTDIPGYAGLGSGWDWTRGVGATQWYPITSCAEENLLCLRDDVYAREDVCVHETAHSLQGSGGKLPTQRLTLLTGGEDLDAAIDTLYDSAMSDGLFDNTYAASNHEEYWAEGVQAYFGINAEGPVGGDGVHNQIDTRAELQAYDPPLFDLIHGIFPDDVDMSCLETTDKTTHCPLKGDTTYFDLNLDGSSHNDVAWSYTDTIADAEVIKDLVAFDNSIVQIVEHTTG